MISFVEALNTARFSIEPEPPLPSLLVRQHLARVADARSGCRHVVSMLGIHKSARQEFELVDVCSSGDSQARLSEVE